LQTRAAVAHKAGAPLTIETVDVAGPRAGEVLVEIKASGVCHTDEFTRSGADPEGLFPAIFGHEGAGIVVDVGPGAPRLGQRAGQRGEPGGGASPGRNRGVSVQDQGNRMIDRGRDRRAGGRLPALTIARADE
jgi:NADPH:quinone reductase-like Zn-dependent oxidoreductase